MGYVGNPDAIRGLTSVRRLREGGPGSGPRPHGGSQKKPYIGKHTRQVLTSMARDNGHGPKEYYKFIAKDPKSQGALEQVERAFSKMSDREKDTLASGEQSEQKAIVRKYGEDGKAANRFLNRVFDPPYSGPKEEQKSDPKAESYGRQNGLSSRDAKRFGQFVGSGGHLALKDTSPKGVLNRWKEWYT